MTEKLKPGAKLDARVAVEVMGWHRGCEMKDGIWWFTKTSPRPGYDPGFPCPKFSTEIAAAWEMVHVIRLRDRETQERFLSCLEAEVAPACVGSVDGYPGTRWTPLYMTPMAICEAALAAVKGE